jgi:hypothetical protein
LIFVRFSDNPGLLDIDGIVGLAEVLTAVEEKKDWGLL